MVSHVQKQTRVEEGTRSLASSSSVQFLPQPQPHSVDDDDTIAQDNFITHTVLHIGVGVGFEPVDPYGIRRLRCFFSKVILFFHFELQLQ